MERFRELLFLKNIKGVGKSTIYKRFWHYLSENGCIDALFESILQNEPQISKEELDKALAVSETIYNKTTEDSSINVITVLDQAYPSCLNDLKERRPLILYTRGDVSALEQRMMAIIGTRKPSEWSRKVEVQLVNKIIQESDFSILSGLAMGCDKIAHETALNANRTTIAVLPSGINVITPASHKDLVARILDQKGCILSEYEPDVEPTKSQFVERDAVVAAFSEISFVVECGIASGTMHTVDSAFKMGRKLACYCPDDKSKGIYDGNTFMVETKGAWAISNTDELLGLLKGAGIRPVTKTTPVQLSITDYISS